MTPTPQERRNEIIRRFDAELERQMKVDIHEVMATPAGRRLFIAMCNLGGLHEFSAKSDNHSYVCGKHDAVLQLFKTVRSREPVMASKAQAEWDESVSRRIKALDELTDETTKP